MQSQILNDYKILLFIESVNLTNNTFIPNLYALPFNFNLILLIGFFIFSLIIYNETKVI